MTGSINSQYAKENPFTIKKMKRGDIKYVWITEKSHNDLYTDGFFDITGEENQNIDCRYIFMKIVCDEASGSISVAYPNNEFKMLCQITKSGKLEYFEKTCEENTYIDNNGNTKYYVDVDKINVEDGNPANITVPIINPYKPIEYSIGLGKKLATGKLSDYKYPENLSDVEKELINDTSKFVSGAKFSVKQAFSQGNGNNTAWKDLGEVDENNNQVVVSKNGGYTDITGDEIPTGYSFIWYRIQEIAPVSGGKLNSNVYYVLMENYIQNSAEGNGVLVHLYKNPEINSETQIPIRDKNHEISTRIEGNGDIFIADKEDGFMVFFDTSTNSIQFVMVDENNTKKYNVNLAKINKDDIKDFSLEELNSDSIKQKMVENVKFNVKQEKKTTTEYLTEKNEKTVTTVQGDYTSVYKDVSIKSNNYETYTINEINAIGHRVVHGGEKFADPVLVDDDVVAGIRECAELAPVHNMAAAMGIEACRNLMPNKPNVVVFDNGFHQTIPEERFLYPIPYHYYRDYKIRKYGFHGTSHSYVSKRVAEVMGKPVEELKTVVCHIGQGASICAVEGGKSVDTSMGLTPLGGIMMCARSGDLDPSVVTYIMKKDNIAPEKMDLMLNKESGLLGMSGVSADVRDVEAAADEGNERAILALKAYDLNIAQYVAKYGVSMGGIDTIVFTAGVGENQIRRRASICKNLEFLGVKLDEEKNKIKGEEIEISAPDSKIKVYVIPTNEELVIARETKNLISK
jgi:acetate kinase